MKRSVGLLAAGLVVVTVGFWWTRGGRARTEAAPAEQPARAAVAPPDAAGAAPARAGAVPTASASPGRALYDAVVVGPCNLAPLQEQDISSQVEGTLLEMTADLGQPVRPGQALARLDDRLLRPQVDLLEIKASSDAARRIARAQYEEADANLTMAKRLAARSAIPPVEFRTYLYQRDRHAEELRKAAEDQEVARKELAKAQQTLALYTIRSRIAGEVTRVYKRCGETVKETEPVFCVANFDRLRVEGLCKVQQASLLRVGMRALVEPELRGAQLTELSGHTGAVNGLAVAPDGRLVGSASEDRTVLVWQWPQGTRVATLRHPGEVHAVAFDAARDGSGRYRLLTGGLDARARLWSLTIGGPVEGPIVLGDGHEGAIRAVAFSPDGKSCATGGEDRKIAVWDVASGQRRYWVPTAEDGQESAHQGAVTAVHFTRDGYLVSAGRDNALKVWKLGEQAAVLTAAYPGRSGEAGAVGLSPDGRRLLFDHGEELRILDRDSGAVLGALRSLRQGRFHGFATFAPDGQAVLTAANTGRLQLWKLPAGPEETRFLRQAYAYGFGPDALFPLQRLGSPLAGWAASGPRPPSRALWVVDGYEALYYIPPNPAAVTCGAFTPDGTVAFTGGADRVVRVWGVPPAAEWQQPLEAELTYVGTQVERGTDTVRVRAELANPREPGRCLRPGTYANLRLYPETVAGR
jgi:WD40 repeat protein/biotin carboxyl carrier protein